MAKRTQNLGGRKPKGDRRLLGTRLPRPLANEVERMADASGETISDYIAAVLIEHMATAEVPNSAQGELMSLREEIGLNKSA